MWGIHLGLVNSPHKWPVTRKMFPFDDVIMWKYRLQNGGHHVQGEMSQVHPNERQKYVIQVWSLPCVLISRWHKKPGSRFNIKMSYQYRKSHCGDKTVVRSSYLHNGISYTGKMTSLNWIRAQSIVRCDINWGLFQRCIWALKHKGC